MSDFHNKSQFLTIVLVCGTGAFLFVMRNNPLANSSLDLSAVNAAVTPLPHDTALIQPVSLKVVMLLVICFCTRAYPQSERLVSMTAPNSRLYTTICITERCEIHKAVAGIVVSKLGPGDIHLRRIHCVAVAWGVGDVCARIEAAGTRGTIPRLAIADDCIGDRIARRRHRSSKVVLFHLDCIPVRIVLSFDQIAGGSV